jgi:hypothetical protein
MGWHNIVLGIGNPGPEYDGTRHNVGFLVLDLLAERLGLRFGRLERHADDGSRRFSGKVKAQVCEGRRKGRSFLLVKPQTYVNLSGDVAGPLLRHAGRAPDSLFVIVDDLNLPLGVRGATTASSRSSRRSDRMHFPVSVSVSVLRRRMAPRPKGFVRPTGRTSSWHPSSRRNERFSVVS